MPTRTRYVMGVVTHTVRTTFTRFSLYGCMLASYIPRPRGGGGGEEKKLMLTSILILQFSFHAHKTLAYGHMALRVYTCFINIMYSLLSYRVNREWITN